MPDRQIGPYLYHITQVPNLTEEGDCDPPNLTIRIREGLPAARAEMVENHEALHALFDATGVGRQVGAELEERIVDAIAPWIIVR